jgi:hypothetical protein
MYSQKNSGVKIDLGIQELKNYEFLNPSNPQSLNFLLTDPWILSPG